MSKGWVISPVIFACLVGTLQSVSAERKLLQIFPGGREIPTPFSLRPPFPTGTTSMLSIGQTIFTSMSAMFSSFQKLLIVTRNGRTLRGGHVIPGIPYQVTTLSPPPFVYDCSILATLPPQKMHQTGILACPTNDRGTNHADMPILDVVFA